MLQITKLAGFSTKNYAMPGLKKYNTRSKTALTLLEEIIINYSL
jgi:hypothetical protein